MQSTRTCSFPGCDRPHKGHGLCQGHCKQQRKGQDLHPLRSRTLEGRFWHKVQKTDGCWEWAGATDGKNYGRIRDAGRLRLAHRVAWELMNGPIPEGIFLDHRCANTLCVNPSHLRAVTNAQNLQHRTGPQSNGTSGVRGVSWSKNANAWRAYAALNGREHHGGYHSNLGEADAAARVLRKELHTHDDHDQWVNNNQGA